MNLMKRFLLSAALPDARGDALDMLQHRTNRSGERKQERGSEELQHLVTRNHTSPPSKTLCIHLRVKLSPCHKAHGLHHLINILRPVHHRTYGGSNA